ncbi:unnamed protein product [Vicia faba]|uniref:Uncharacterized protein n=1 Tax=Vicia faba TaxID=3906 RepID=A0AAV1ANP3_VICFA|nr:unnamed protein product [Vicia faba]
MIPRVYRWKGRRPSKLDPGRVFVPAQWFTFVAVDLLRTASSFSLTTVPQASFSSPSLPIDSVSTFSSFRFRVNQTQRFISSSIIVSVPHPHLLPNELQPRMTGVAADPQRLSLDRLNSVFASLTYRARFGAHV